MTAHITPTIIKHKYKKLFFPPKGPEVLRIKPLEPLNESTSKLL